MYRGLLPFTRTSCIYCVLGNEQSLSFLLRVASDCIRFHPDSTVSRIFSTQLLKAAFSISFKHYVSVSWMLTGTELHGISEDFTVWFTREVRPWKGCPGRNPSWRLSWKKPFLKLKGCMLRQVTIERLNIQKEKKTKPRCNFSYPRMARFALCSFSGDQLYSLTFVTLTALAESRRIWQNLASRRAGSNFLKLCHLDARILSWIPLWSDGELPMLRRLWIG